MDGQSELIGRGSREAARLIRGWFAEQDRAAAAGEPAAYVFVMGSIAEVLRSFGLHLVFPEIHALQTAVRHVAHDYLSVAEDYGYSPDICGYVKADVAVQLQDGRHPMGRIPKPALAVLTNACNTYLKWGEIWERMWHTPLVTIDIPGSREATRRDEPGSDGFERDRRYVEAQLRELIAACERITGRSFDEDRLREAMEYTNRMTAAWRRMLELNRARPAVFNALVDGTMYLGVMNALRGTASGATFFEDLVAELEYKADRGIGALPEEHWRLVFVGVPCYPIFRRFHELFADRGGVFVCSTYLWFASGGADLGPAYETDRPLESLSRGVLRDVRHAGDAMLFPDRHIVALLDGFGADGVVYHPIKSCRTVSTGLASSRKAVMAQRDVMALFIESDMMDRRVVSEAQLKNRVDAFFEGLHAKRVRSRAAAAAGAVA
ncbi:MAG TPA: 2-hydroxyacyl-CoA dehydratase family protein [Gemmatimonadales bacterium]|nr:2-hydroxyacyl-CoA dehydratase family protein [Gemmatimonadales bacterium]